MTKLPGHESYLHPHVRAPTADSSDNEINSFYNDLQITLSIPKKTMLSFWETSMLRLVLTSPYRKIPLVNLVWVI